MSTYGFKSATARGEWRYSKPAVLLHWLIAILIAAQLGIGWYMMAIEEQPGSIWYFDIHKSFGLVVLGLVVLRIIWRATHKPAALPMTVPAWQVTLIHVTEWALYLCMLAMPIIGFVGASYSKKGITFFGTPLPSWFSPNHDTAETFFGLHSIIAWVLVALIALHALGGLKHFFIDKDRIFQRMWF
ncbi:cytochrome b [Herminiimonas glaciei]|uniref:Cytochrome b n=1 Tax=Herminiimonas glaciei TaxID=523788 RepID=A0ABW2I6H4_9BURK